MTAALPLLKLLFKAFHAPAFYVTIQAPLSFYATDIVVLDAGDGVSHAVSMCLPRGVLQLRLDLACTS